MGDEQCKLAGRLSGGKWDKMHDISRRVYDTDGIAPTVHTAGGGNTEVKIVMGALRGRNPENPNDRTAGAPTVQMLELRDDEVTNTITTVQKDNVVVSAAGIYTRASKAFQRGPLQDKSRSIRAGCDDAGVVVKERFFRQAIETVKAYDVKPGDTVNAYNQSVNGSGTSPTVTTRPEGFKTAILAVDEALCVRKLTPLECWRLFDFRDKDFYAAKKALEEKHYNGKDKASSQLYKQAGNTIAVPVLEAIFSKIKGLELAW